MQKTPLKPSHLRCLPHPVLLCKRAPARAKVRFAFELLCALQPGMPVMALHGKCKHARRTQIYLDFVRRPGAVLLATDIAARGLDFPSVDWVIQVRQRLCNV